MVGLSSDTVAALACGGGGGPVVAAEGGAQDDRRPHHHRCLHHLPLRMHTQRPMHRITPIEAAAEVVLPGLPVGEGGSLPPTIKATTNSTTLLQPPLLPARTETCPSSSSILSLP